MELIGDVDVPPIDEDSASAAREAFADLAERATGERPEPEELEGASAYAIAARIELPPDTKQSSWSSATRTSAWSSSRTPSGPWGGPWSEPRRPLSAPAATARSTSPNAPET